ncbi:hypothetical protein HAX54_013434 [Datura stramonium]|uniref:F-box associated domain-containing protein n=1 Tax=Datura stramonium TaxID=4076 RepID=A0ABS8RY72_DATST|nr:hypothetical protein [Datura stramonium]
MMIKVCFLLLSLLYVTELIWNIVEFLIHANRLSRSTTVDLGFLYADRQPNDRFELVASCGDLILLSSGKNYCICNILTRQWIALPPAPSGRGNFGESIGFMYEPLDDRHNKYLSCSRLIRLIDVPDEARDIPFMDSKLGVCGGRLQFAILIFQHCRQPRIRVWELEDDYRMGNWRMVHNVRHASTNRIFRRTYKISILAFHPYNKDLICFLVSNDLVVVYNMRTNDVEYYATVLYPVIHQNR